MIRMLPPCLDSLVVFALQIAGLVSYRSACHETLANIDREIQATAGWIEEQVRFVLMALPSDSALRTKPQSEQRSLTLHCAFNQESRLQQGSVVEPADPKSAQLIRLVARAAATEDLMFELERALLDERIKASSGKLQFCVVKALPHSMFFMLTGWTVSEARPQARSRRVHGFSISPQGQCQVNATLSRAFCLFFSQTLDSSCRWLNKLLWMIARSTGVNNFQS